MKDYQDENGDWQIEVDIVGETENGWKCEYGHGQPAFILPKSKSVAWGGSPSVGARHVHVMVPNWLALNHRQIVGDVAFEENKKQRGRR